VEIRRQILEEAYNSRYSVHPGGTKMYRDVRLNYWWNNMKKEIANYVDKCLTCQRVKVELQHPVGELRPMKIPAWKWDSISTDFIMGLPLSVTRKNTIWVIVDQLTKSVHFLPVRDTWNFKRLA